MRPATRTPAVLLAVLLLPAPLAAQPAPPSPPSFLLLSVIDVKPDLIAEFGELQAQAMEAQRKGGQAWRETWHGATFGHPYRVGVLWPIATFAEFDGQTFTIKGAGVEQARMINERARRMIVAQRIYALQSRPDLGFGDRPERPNLSVLTSVTVAPGRNEEFENILKNEIVPAYKKAGEGSLAVSQVVLGGNPDQYLIATLVDDFAAFDKGNPLRRGLGPEGFAKFQKRLTGIVVQMEHDVYRFNPALSFRTPPFPSGRPR